MRRYYTVDTMRQKYEWKEQKLAGKVMHDRWFNHVEKIISLTYLRPFTLTPCTYDREGKNFIYLADQSGTKFLVSDTVYFKPVACSGIHQGGKALYQNHPGSGLLVFHAFPMQSIRC